jgi:hypothetical protein
VNSIHLLAANQTQAAALLDAFGGDETRAAQALQAVGPSRLTALIDGGKVQTLTQLLALPHHIDRLNDPGATAARRQSAIEGLRQAVRAYAAQGQATREAGQAGVGEPAEFPPQANAEGPKPGLVEVLTIAKEIGYKSIGGQIDRNINRTLGRFVFEPWNRFVAQPTATAAIDMYSRFASTPVGQHFETQRVQAAGVVQSVLGENTPIGTMLRVFDRAVVKNERLWDTVDKAGAVGRKAAAGAAGTTLAIVANAYRTGTLQTGTFNSSGDLTAAQKEMVRQVNIPQNINVRYFTVPTTLPVTVKGHTYQVQAHATIVVGEGSGVLLLPALGPGKPGAQPWFGPVQDGGLSRTERQLVSASSSVAAAHWDVLGFNIGTTNFNAGGRADLQFGRGLFNIFAAQLKRDDVGPGTPRATLQTIAIGDLWSTFHSATFNVGPLAVVVDRFRNPQNERVTLPRGDKTFTFGGDAHSSSVQPAFPLTGAGTWDPGAEDIQMFNAWFGTPPRSTPRPAP